MDQADLDALEAMPSPSSKAELLARIPPARAALGETVAALTEDELADLRDGAGWATIDHLSHIAAWERMIVAHLTDGSDHEIVGVDAVRYATMSLDELNNVLYHRMRGLTLGDALREYAAAHEAIVAFLRTLDDAVFASAYWDDDPSGRTVMEKVTGDTYRHYLEHRRWIRELIRS
ncbi:MAG TPA: ClbS/DfsB family four-helix bundle protein [Dehalococcoidia bacterium]